MTIQTATPETESGTTENALDYIRDGVIIVGGDRRILHVDAALCRMLGVKDVGEDAAIQTVIEHIQLSGAQPISAVVEEIFEAGYWRGEGVGLTSDNLALYLEITGRRFSVRSGAGAILVVRNVTRDRMIETQVLDAQQMELVDKLSRGIAHEYKNLLTIIIAYGSMLQMSLTDKEALDEAGKIVETAERANDLTARLVSITQRTRPKRGSARLNAVLREVEDLTLKAVAPDVLVSIVSDDAFPTVRVDSGGLVRVIIHLMLNAAEAMPDGGRLHVDAECIDIAEDDLDRYPAARPGSYAVVSVTDTGFGIPPDVKKRMFEPFYTTKKEGSGLGLPAVQSLLAVMNGWLNVYTAVGEGTCMKIYIPVADREDTQVIAPAGTAAADNPLTILVVDDDAPMVEMTRTFLERAGHRVLTAANGAEAVRTYRDHAADIHVVLLDVIMPEMNGREVYGELRACTPALPVLMTSGFPRAKIVEIMGEKGLPYIAKPYTKAGLIQALRHAVSGAS